MTQNANKIILNTIVDRRRNVGRSVEVTATTQLVWLCGLQTPNLPTTRKKCNQKDANKKIGNNLPDIDGVITVSSNEDVIKMQYTNTYTIRNIKRDFF